MTEPLRIANVRTYVRTLSGLPASACIPAHEPLGRRPEEPYAAVRLISDEDEGVPAVRYRRRADGTEEEQVTTPRLSRYQVDFIGESGQMLADTFINAYPLSAGTNLEDELSISVQRASRLDAPEAEEDGWRGGCSVELEILWREESAWRTVPVFETADVRLFDPERQRIIPLTTD